jgi:hypothetical protein
MANEKIAATAIYYYDSENIEEDCLNFRQSVELVKSAKSAPYLLSWVPSTEYNGVRAKRR